MSLAATLSSVASFPEERLIPTTEKPNTTINNTTISSSRVKPLLRGKAQGAKPKDPALFTLNLEP
jgi:hypothetical protein